MENGEIPTYEEAFPPLSSPTSTTAPSSAIQQQQQHQSGGMQSAWPVRPIPSSSVTQVFHVPFEERRYSFDEPSFGVESKQIDIVRDIQEKTCCDIEMSQTKDRGLTIMVTGKPSHVLKARKELLQKLQTQAHIDLKIPKEHHRFVIGKEGQKLKNIELSTATKISIPRPDDSSDIIKIVGTKEGLDKARHQIQLISDEQAKLAFERLDIDYVYHPFIMGPNNSSVKSIMDATGARINIPPFSLTKSEITVAGDKEGVAKATNQIMRLYDEMRRNSSTVSVEVRKSQHKYIVGPRGHGLQDILSATGVWVEVPSSDMDVNTITLRGPQEKLGQALTLVYERANSVLIEEVHAPRWLHRFIIGRKGQNVQKITQDLAKVHVEFNSDLEKIILEGPPEQVQQAKEAFDTFTEDLVATMDYAEIQVEQKYHRHIIGKGGASVNRIKTETGTSIIIPPDDEKNDIIRIEGDPKGVQAARTMLLEMAAKMENERSKDVIIEHRFHKQIIGAKGEKIREIRDRFNGVQVAFPEPGENKDVVSLRGPKEDVEKCAMHLKKLGGELAASNYCEEVHVFKKFHANVIGKGGATLRKIREETDTKIELPGEKAESDTIVITGRKENVQKAKARLQAIEKEMASITDVSVHIPHRLHNAIIGPKGKLVQSVMTECGGVRIQFPPGDSKSDEVKLHGPKDDVERARKLLLELMEEQAQEHHTVEIRCKPEYHRFLIGRNGANIRKVRDQFGARIIFPQKSSSSDDDPETVTIIGRKEKVEGARTHLMKLIKDLENIVEEEMVVDPKYYRHFIQRRGQLIHEISQENGGIVISFPRANSKSDKVILKGARQCIDGAKARIREIVEDLKSQVTIECIIEQKHHRSIMGPKGAHVQSITSLYDVSIKFPDREKPSSQSEPQNKDATSIPPTQDGRDIRDGEGEDGETIPNPRNIILITGRQENVESAKEALIQLIPVRVEMDIDLEFHRYIVGQKGQEVRSLMDQHDVNIVVPSPDKKSTVVVITGPARNCDEARKGLERRVQQLEAEKEERELRSFTVTLKIDSKHHPNIIGRKGVTINKIREQHDVRIQLPDKNGPNSDEITITGYEHNVREAEDDIMKIVQELEDQITDEVTIDHRVHSRLIGARGKNIAKVMEKFRVDIRFPRDKNSDQVTITGLEENVEDCKEHLLMLADDYIQDVIEKAEEEAMMQQYTVSKTSNRVDSTSKNRAGFVVSGAPWSAISTDDFPTLGGGGGGGDSSSSSSSSSNMTASGSVNLPLKKKQWGPSAFGPKLPRSK